MTKCIAVVLLLCICILAVHEVIPVRASSAPLSSVRDLPLSEVPAPSGGDTLALFITGDGGWAELDEHVSMELAHAGISVVGLSSLKYFWHSRTPELAARDVAHVLRHYLKVWQRRRILLIGYSFGADAMPFIVNRLPPDLRPRITTVSLLGLSANASFQVSAAELLDGSSQRPKPVLPEIERMGNIPVLCVYGEGEDGSLCPALAKRATRVRIGEGHHFSGDYPGLARAITAFAHRAGE